MCAAFAAAGAEVTLYHPNRRNLPEFAGVDPRGYYGVARNFALCPIPCVDWFHWSRGWLWLEHFIFLVLTCTYALALARRFVGRSQADVYYSRDPFALALLRAILPHLRGRLFFEAHALPGSGLGRRLYRLMLAQARGIVAITEGLRAQLVELGLPPGSVMVAPDGVDLQPYEGRTREAARKRLGIGQHERIAVYTGHLYEWKGAAIFAEAVACLDGLARGLIVGGRAADVARLREQIDAQGWRNVVLIGHVPPELVIDYQVAADVLVLPNSAQAEISEQHTSPLKLFEYMAAGRPIVATDLPALREVLRHGDNALLVPPDDPVALAAGLRKVLDDADDLGKRLATQARTEVRAYSWDARARAILEFAAQDFGKWTP